MQAPCGERETMILFVTGPANVGKTAVCQHLAKRRRAVHIEVDVLRHFVVDDEYRLADDFQAELSHINTLGLLANYNARGWDVIVTDISYDPAKHDLRMADYREIAPAASVLLNCRKELLENDRNKYDKDSLMAGRLAMLHEAFGRKDEIYDLVIDTSEMTIDEVANVVDRFWNTLG